MNTKLVCIVFLGILAINTFMSAAEPPKELITPMDIVMRALIIHPDLQRAELAVRQADLLGGKASQVPNPELSAKSIYGNNAGDGVMSHELGFMHTLELGGKRAVRIDKAAAEKALTFSELLKTKEEVYISTLKTLYRIRQVHEEIKAMDEALDTFTRIQKQFKARPTLSPENDVALNLFQIAEGDYQLRKAQLESEEYSLERSIETAISAEFPHKESILPLRRQQWPEFTGSSSDAGGSDISKAQAELKNAQAEVGIAKSESESDLALGPVLQSQAEGAVQYWMIGLSASATLPLYQSNRGGRAVAAAGLARAEQNLALKQSELKQQRRMLLKQYQKSAQSFNASVSTAELARKHKVVENQFDRGLVSGALVIEAHRQIMDFTQSQNKQELLALESLWRLRVLDGTLFEGDL